MLRRSVRGQGICEMYEFEQGRISVQEHTWLHLEFQGTLQDQEHWKRKSREMMSSFYLLRIPVRHATVGRPHVEREDETSSRAYVRGALDGRGDHRSSRKVRMMNCAS